MLTVPFAFSAEEMGPSFDETFRQRILDIRKQNAAHMLEQLDGLELKVIFRSDHASNYLPLKGTLPKDRDRLLAQLGAAQSGEVALRPEWARGL